MKKDTPGRIFHRMVDTVLSRDKNWVYWKMANCPTIKREPVEPQLYADAQSLAAKLTTSKRLRPVPMGAVSLDFLRRTGAEDEVDEANEVKRSKLPDLESFKASIADDDFEIGMATNDRTKAKAVAGKASKSWRALRIASRSRLAVFDKIEDSNVISIVFEAPKDDDDDATMEDADALAPDDQMQDNRAPIILSGPSGVGKTTLLNTLLESHRGIFGEVVRHTTRLPAEGEVNGRDFQFVKPQEFNQLRDGDRLIEYTEADQVSYGTSIKAIEAITEKGKIPIIQMDMDVSANPPHTS